MLANILNVFTQAATFRNEQAAAEAERRRDRYWATTTPEQHSRNLADDVDGYTEEDKF